MWVLLCGSITHKLGGVVQCAHICARLWGADKVATGYLVGSGLRGSLGFVGEALLIDLQWVQLLRIVTTIVGIEGHGECEGGSWSGPSPWVEKATHLWGGAMSGLVGRCGIHRQWVHKFMGLLTQVPGRLLLLLEAMGLTMASAAAFCVLVKAIFVHIRYE